MDGDARRGRGSPQVVPPFVVETAGMIGEQDFREPLDRA
jgi:hypothetical protein